ncbi:MAG: flavodoxin [Alphaproteobacteria bacterium]|jgi:flavodoxin
MLKKLAPFFVAFVLLAAAVPAEARQNGGNNMSDKSKTLIAYYSWSGNTRKAAEAIQAATGGDLFEIQTAQPYPEVYRALTDQAKKEIADGYRPALKNKVPDISGYDVVFVGSPNWWGTIAPAVSTFLGEYDLSGKTVVPFVTHGGGGVQRTVSDLTAQCTGCSVARAFVTYGGNLDGIEAWLKEGGFAE